MSDEKPKLSPQEGFEAVMKVMPDIDAQVDAQDLGGLGETIDQLTEIAKAAGMEPDAASAQFDGLKDQTVTFQHHFANMDAALWAGDMKRFEALNENMPDFDPGAMGEDDFDDDDGLSFEITFVDEDASDDVEIVESDDTLEDVGFDFQGIEDIADIIPDRYAEIAAGEPGAVAAFIATGQDPNVPTGESQHTAFLAALDAPRRNADDLRALIAAGADPLITHVLGDTALAWAVAYHHFDTVTAESEKAIFALLVEVGLDVHQEASDFGSPIRGAIVRATTDQVAALLDLGADPSEDLPLEFSMPFLAGASPIIAAAPKPDMVKLLLEHGVDPTKTDAAGQIPVAFIQEQAEGARARADDNDPWTIPHAEDLETSLGLLQDHIAKRS